MKIATAAEARRLDASVIEEFGVPQAVLMENAALAACRVAELRWGIANKDVLVVCGRGSNGGDGLALSRLLYAKGAAVTVIMASDPSMMTGAAAVNLNAVRSLPLEVILYGKDSAASIRPDFTSYDYLIDALFGTGLSRPLEGYLGELTDAMNASDRPILSLDIPSGVHADSGALLGNAVNADATVTFGLPKRGNLLFPGFAQGGELYYSEISFPPEVCSDASVSLSVNIPPTLPTRNPAGHKGSFGKVLIIGGAPNYRGAPALAGAAALRSGAGYARIAVPADLVPQIFPLIPEAVFIPQDGGDGTLTLAHAEELLNQAAAADSVVLGPGLSTDSESKMLALELAAGIQKPLILDGDGLSALAGREELGKNRNHPSILTPHPGEMARLLGTSIAEVEAARVECALEAADRYGAVVVLKGAHTIIASPEGRAWMNLNGNSGMGTAGSGDVLAGVCGALAVGMEAVDAARLAVYLHGLAGDLAAAGKGEVGMTASDILENLPRAITVASDRTKSDPYSGRICLL